MPRPFQQPEIVLFRYHVLKQKQREISDAMGISQATVSRVLKKYAETGDAMPSVENTVIHVYQRVNAMMGNAETEMDNARLVDYELRAKVNEDWRRTAAFMMDVLPVMVDLVNVLGVSLDPEKEIEPKQVRKIGAGNKGKA